MLAAEGSVQVAATPREVLEFVCDLRAYMALDGKIVNVYENPPIDSDGNGFAVIRGSVRGIRSPKQRLAVRLDRWWSVTFESAGPWLTDRLMWFRGGLVARPSHGGSWVTHSYRFRFKGPLGPLFERYLRQAGSSRTSTTSSSGSRPTSTGGPPDCRRWSPFPTGDRPAPTARSSGRGPGSRPGRTSSPARLGLTSRPVGPDLPPGRA